VKLYNDYATYLKGRYGCRVYKIGLDAGFTCPNRDGTKSTGGCVYCTGSGARASYTVLVKPVEEQLSDRIRNIKAKDLNAKFIAYFQAFTNTYAPAEKLKTVYDTILPFDDIAGLSVGTRPDAVDREKMQLIATYKKKYDVWLEYGLQTIHERTLQYLNRGHTFDEFRNALDLAKEFHIPVCAHIILGLPGETHSDMIATARVLSGMKIDGIKIHLLHILKGSALEALYNAGKVQLLERRDYIELACDFLENLSPEIVIQRLTGEGTREDHVAPLWALDKNATIQGIKETLASRGSCQGTQLLSDKKT